MVVGGWRKTAGKVKLGAQNDTRDGERVWVGKTVNIRKEKRM